MSINLDVDMHVLAVNSILQGSAIEMVSPYNPRLALPWVMGGWNTETLPGLALLSREINRQAAMIGYIEAFAMYTAASAAAVVLVVLMTNRQRRALPVSG